MTRLRGAPALALALVATAVLRLPAFAWGVVSDDEGIYEAMARRVAAGGVMYRDVVDHKPPGLTYTYAACRLLAGTGPGATVRAMHLVHAVGLLTACATALVVFFIARRLRCGPDPAGAVDDGVPVWAAALYGVVSAAKQPVDGLAVNGELLMNLPLSLAVLSALAAGEARGARRVGLDVAAGVLCGVAGLYKYQAVLLGLALPLLPRRGALAPSAAPLRGLRGRGLAWLAGVTLPFAAAALYFLQRGVLDEAVFWGVRFNREYLKQAPGFLWSLQRLAMQLGGVVAPGLLLYGGAAWGLRRPQSSSAPAARAAHRFVVAWAVLSLAAVTLGGRFFGHYFLQAELPLALLAAPAVARLSARHRALALGALLLPAAGFAVVAAQPALSTSIFNRSDPDFIAAGHAAAAASRPGDSIWVWGNVPQIYFFADRMPGARFTFCNYLTGLSPATPSEYDRTFDPRRDRVAGALALALADLDRLRPALLLDTAENDLKQYGRFPLRRFPELQAFVEAHYRRGETVAGVVFYRRSEGPTLRP